MANADESEPGTFKDRVILDRSPRRFLAGMRLTAHAAGCATGIIYLRSEYHRQHDRLDREIGRLRGEGWFDSRFDVTIHRGAGLYVCGEETALLNSIEGRRPMTRERPPYPLSRGLDGLPTLIHNVETLAAVTAIVERGPDWFREAGRPKLYSISGDISSPGVHELPMSARVIDLIDCAGGCQGDLSFFSMGGLSGGVFPSSLVELGLDHDSFLRHRGALGSGGVIVMGPERCIIPFARDALAFFAEGCCGRCLPCRLGTSRLRECFDDLTRQEVFHGQHVEEIADVLENGAACGLGSAAARVVRNVLEHFELAFQAHGKGECPICRGGEA